MVCGPWFVLSIVVQFGPGGEGGGGGRVEGGGWKVEGGGWRACRAGMYDL